MINYEQNQTKTNISLDRELSNTTKAANAIKAIKVIKAITAIKEGYQGRLLRKAIKEGYSGY